MRKTNLIKSIVCGLMLTTVLGSSEGTVVVTRWSDEFEAVDEELYTHIVGLKFKN